MKRRYFASLWLFIVILAFGPSKGGSLFHVGHKVATNTLKLETKIPCQFTAEDFKILFNALPTSRLAPRYALSSLKMGQSIYKKPPDDVHRSGFFKINVWPTAAALGDV
jgi:hypothetical protein